MAGREATAELVVSSFTGEAIGSGSDMYIADDLMACCEGANAEDEATRRANARDRDFIMVTILVAIGWGEEMIL